MKRPLICTLGIAIATAGSVNAIDSYSPTLGYYTTDVPAGYSTMVIGLVKKKDHQGGMDNVGVFTVSDGETTIVENDRDMTTVPLDNHYVEVLDGPFEGLVLDVVAGSATSNSFRVNGNLNSFSGLAPDSSIAIRNHATLGDLFPDGGGFNAFVDFLIFFDPEGAAQFYAWDGAGTWQDLLNAGAPANDKVVYPGQGFLIFADAAREILVGKNGVSHVKEGKTMIPYYQNGLNLIGQPNPVVGKNSLLGDLDFPSSINSFVDFVITFSDDGLLNASGFYSSDGSVMQDLINGGSGDLAEIPVGSALFLQLDPGSADNYYTAPALDPASLVEP